MTGGLPGGASRQGGNELPAGKGLPAGSEAARLLADYVRIDTTNPPGNERAAAEFLAQALRERGLEPKLYPSAPGRANVAARLRAKAGAKAGAAPAGATGRGPILLHHHMDVVLAETERWSVDPFGGEVREGYLYGRGAIDMKSFGVMQLLALDRLIREDRPLRRDVIFLAVADEEAGGRYGAGFMVDNHWDDLRPEVVWDEGGFGLAGLLGPAPVFYVAVAEKHAVWSRLVATGEAGLGSVPRGNNPVDALAAALERVRAAQAARRGRFAPRLTAVTAEMLRRLAGTTGFPRSFLLRHAGNPLFWPLVRRALTAEPVMNASFRNLVTATGLRAGEKVNVVPAQAEASLDVRLLPDEDVEAFMAELQQLVGGRPGEPRAAVTDGGGPRVTLEWPAGLPHSSVSPFEGEFFAAIEAAVGRCVPGGVVVPMQTPGGTDSLYFRMKGVPAYGLIPILLGPGELDRMHGVDERISLENLELGTRVVYEAVAAAAGA